MPKHSFPDSLEMRRVKYAPDVLAADKDRVAEALVAADRRAEALLLYEGRPDAARVKETLAWAVREGVSWYLATLRRMGAAVTEADTRACAEAAEARGRWYDAHRCFTVLEDAAGLERVAQKLPGYKIAVPANKA